MIGEVREPIPCAPGQPMRINDEYVRNGVAEIFMEVEPLAGRRHVAVTEHRTRKDWAQLLDESYLGTNKVRLVMDNLNTHNITSLYGTFDPKEARRLAERLEIHSTPRHGSWLNMAEIEISILKGHCLDRRIPDMAPCKPKWLPGKETEITVQKKIVWQFTTPNARI